MDESARIWSLMTRKLSGEATPGELEEWQALLRRQPRWQYAYEMLASWWPLPAHPAEGAAESLQQLQERLRAMDLLPDEPVPGVDGQPYPWESERPRRGRGKTVLIGALLLTAGSTAFWLAGRHRSPTAATMPAGGQSEVSTRYGSKSRVQLPDGSTVWLNSGSNLTYDIHQFGQGHREVTLTGEGYFDVAGDASHPFLIHAGEIRVQVLGTAFDVKAYPEDRTVETTLIRGSIAVSLVNQPSRTLTLSPRQKLIVFKDRMDSPAPPRAGAADSLRPYQLSALTISPEDSTVVETAWLQNRLVFRSTSFADLARMLERRYNVRINFSDGEVKGYRLTGSFQNETLEEALRALQITAPFQYRVEDQEIYISSAP